VNPKQPSLPGIEPERFPGIDADGYGTHDVHAAVPHGEPPHAELWDPYDGFEAPRRPTQ
jgi:hypothetical protein